MINTPKNNKLDLEVMIRDEADYPVLISAVFAKVDILITGDKDFFGIKIKKPKILTPAMFMEQYG
jgi:predicted nucleic acid-binding protein